MIETPYEREDNTFLTQYSHINSHQDSAESYDDAPMLLNISRDKTRKGRVMYLIYNLENYSENVLK